jgi:hypothetical protein
MTAADPRPRVSVEAGWARWGKYPGSNDDYSVLSCSSGPFSRADYAAILTRFSPGTPSARRQGAGQLPWVTFSWVGAEDKRHLGIAVHDITDQVDGAGRPIAETSYFCVPYAAVADSPISYCGLYEAVRQPAARADGGAPARLQIPRLDPHDIALSVAEYGEPVVASMAALLLNSPVSVTQAEGSELEDRLRFIDAVAALLPFGYRTRFTASTWADSGSRHRIRLTFADRPRDDAAGVPFRAAPDLSGEPASRDYVVQLDRFLRPPAPGSRAFDLTEIVAHLAQETTPRKFDTPHAAIKSLRTIDLPAAVAAAVGDRKAVPDEVRLLFDGGRISELEPDQRRAIWLELLSYGQPQDLTVIDSWWDRVVGEDPAAVMPQLARIFRDLLWTRAPAAPIWDYLRLADRQGIADALLASLAEPPGDPRQLAGALSDAASLVYQRLLGGGPGSHPRTVAALGRNRALLAQVTVDMATADGGASPWLDRLAGVAPGLLATFRAVLLATGKPVTARTIAEVAAEGSLCVRVLVQAASEPAAQARLLPPLADWLATCGMIPAAEQQYWEDQLRRPTILGGRNRAGADLALLAVGLSPHWLAVTAGQPSWEEYASAFSRQWPRLENTPSGRPGATLLTYLDSKTWTEHPDQIWAVQDLTRRLGPGTRLPVTGIVAVISAHTRRASELDFVGEWLRQVETAFPTALPDGALQSLRMLGPEATAGDIASRCWRAYVHYVPAEAAGVALSTSAAFRLPGQGQIDPAARLRMLRDVAAILRRKDKQSRPRRFQRFLAPGGLLSPSQAVSKIRRKDPGATTPLPPGTAPLPPGAESESLSRWAAGCVETAWDELERGPQAGPPASVGMGAPR